MVESERGRVCPVELAGSLDNRVRRWVQNPRKILEPYLKEGMTALDVGCGPGFFTLDMALLVGDSGSVIAADLQQGMLQKVSEKIVGTDLEKRITLHKSESDKIGISGGVDFALVFYMLHEVPNETSFLEEVWSVLNSGGLLLIVEPPFHVSKTAFEKSIARAEKTGFEIVERPKVFFSKTVVLKKN